MLFPHLRHPPPCIVYATRMPDLTHCFQKERWEMRHGTSTVTAPSASISTTTRERSAGPGPPHSRDVLGPSLKERSVQSWLSSLPSPKDEDETASTRRARPPKPISEHSYDHQEYQEDLFASRHPPSSQSSVKHPLERDTGHSECNSCTEPDHHAHCVVGPRCHSTHATHSHFHHAHNPCHFPTPVTRCGVRPSCQDQDACGHGCSCQGSHDHHSICSHAPASHTPHHPPYLTAHHIHAAAETSAVQHGGAPQQTLVTPSLHSGREKGKGAAEKPAKQTKSNQTRSPHTIPTNNSKEGASHGNHKGKAGVKTVPPKPGIHYSFFFNTTNVHNNTSIHGPTHNVDARSVHNNLNIHPDKASAEPHRQDAKKTGVAQAPSSMASKHGGAEGLSKQVVPLRKGFMHTPPKTPAPRNLLQYPGRHDDMLSGQRPGGKGGERALVAVR